MCYFILFQMLVEVFNFYDSFAVGWKRWNEIRKLFSVSILCLSFSICTFADTRLELSVPPAKKSTHRPHRTNQIKNILLLAQNSSTLFRFLRTFQISSFHLLCCWCQSFAYPFNRIHTDCRHRYNNSNAHMNEKNFLFYNADKSADTS